MKSKKCRTGDDVKTVALRKGGDKVDQTREVPQPSSLCHTREQVLAAIRSAATATATAADGNNEASADAADANTGSVERLIWQRVRRKAAGYRSQDEKMGRVAEDNATPDEIVRLLHESRLQCSYCQRAVEMFDAPRSPDGWTLDRKENHVAHTPQNVVVCCLRCNLDKRRRDTEKYRFSKQLSTVRRLGHDDCKSATVLA